MNRDVAILVNDLHKSYRSGSRTLRVINGIHMVIHKGEFAGIVGPSGAGKSTLLHLIGVLDRPDKGKVILNGLDVYALKDRERTILRRKIGFVFQFYHLLPEFTALENVVLPALVDGRSALKRIGKKSILVQRGRGLLESVGLIERADHHPAELSGGEQQRVAIARALMNNPEFILCDEPTGNLDSQSSAEVKELLLSIARKEERALMIVTHQQDIAEGADRIYKIKDGVLV
ncbi:MAG: ABC transporter ATP-binding protein [Candidatus Omnitrophica bacterium]|nr:ABC transporter ATP-binding protein [Candidatus Omnitrophota bacterium]